MRGEEKGVIAGVDIGGTKTKIGFERHGEMNMVLYQATPQRWQDALDMIVRGIHDAVLPGPLAGIGVGCPGPLDQNAGVVLSPPNLPQWREFKMKELLEKHFGVPVKLENDANAGALGEAVAGSGRGAKSVFYMTISTGIGAGIVINGKIYQGAGGMAGELWAFAPSLFIGGESRGNITELASGAGMIKQVQCRIERGEATSIPADDITTQSIIAAWERRDPLARAVIQTARETLAATLCFVIYTINPELVVLGGGLCLESRWMVNPLRRMVKARLAIERLKNTPIRRAKLWNDAVLHGAISLFHG